MAASPEGAKDTNMSPVPLPPLSRLSSSISQHPLSLPPTISTKHSLLGTSVTYISMPSINNRPGSTHSNERLSDEEREAKRPRLDTERERSNSTFSRPIPRNTSQVSLCSSVSGASTAGDNYDDYTDNWTSRVRQSPEPVFIPRRVHSLNDLASLRSSHSLSAVAAIASSSKYNTSHNASHNTSPPSTHTIYIPTPSSSSPNDTHTHSLPSYHNTSLASTLLTSVSQIPSSRSQSLASLAASMMPNPPIPPTAPSPSPTTSFATSHITHLSALSSATRLGANVPLTAVTDDNLDLLAKIAEKALATQKTDNSSMKHSKSMGNLKLAMWEMPSEMATSTSPSPPQQDKDRESKEKKSSQNKKDRPVRPKVVESKGTLQCLGTNRKKKMRCRNAALMEYIGPRPQFCAEHIALDPNAQYHKCDFKGPEDTKGCKEIVYKDFARCYKHFKNWIVEDFTGDDALVRVQRLHSRVIELLTQLEQEASVAKHEDSELYQRKSKLIPKYQSMDNTLKIHVSELKSHIKTITSPSSTPLPLDRPQLNQPAADAVMSRD